MRPGNAIAAESGRARPESRRSRASYRARHTVRRLEPRTLLCSLNPQEQTPRARVPRRRTNVQGGYRFTHFVQSNFSTSGGNHLLPIYFLAISAPGWGEREGRALIVLVKITRYVISAL